MIGRFIVAAWPIIISAQVITVVGTGDSKVDIPAVQAAVDQAERVVLAGRFSFEAAPTVSEPASLLLSGTAGMIRVSKSTAISGALDDQGEMTTIEGGTNPFYVEAPGARVAIEGLHFIHPKAV